MKSADNRICHSDEYLPSNWTLRFQPRQWQKDALEFWGKNLRGVVEVVTGGGKTFFAYLCMMLFRERFPEGRFIVIVPTLSLLDQWYVGLREDLGVQEQHIACYSGQEKPKEPRIINLLVINTARVLAPSIADGYPTFLIVDECHRAGSPENAKALQGSHRASLGLSATPEREYDQGFRDIIQPALGQIIFSYKYDQALKDGVITLFDLVNVRVDLLENEQKRYDLLTKRLASKLRALGDDAAMDPVFKRILMERAAVGATAHMRIPVAAKLVDEHRAEQVIVFHERVMAADKISGILTQRKHSATLYHSKIGPHLRRDNLRLFRSGIFDVLVTCRALDEGMNVPEARVAIIASSTASTRQRIQRLGRVLRPAPGKEFATIYTIYATKQEKIRLAKEATKLREVSSVIWCEASVR